MRKCPGDTCRHKETPDLLVRGFVFALLIFPGSRPPSIVSADELNFCVRDGNRWTLIAINTNFVDTCFISFASVQAPKLTHPAVSPLRTKSASLGFCSVLLVYLSSGCPENISIILRYFHLSSAFFAPHLSPRTTQCNGRERKR